MDDKRINDMFFPIGTVLKTKHSDLELMIIGYNYKYEKKVYDYVAVIHPVGITYVDPNIKASKFFFNKNSIKEVYRIGYIDKKVEERRKHMNNLALIRERDGVKNER